MDANKGACRKEYLRILENGPDHDIPLDTEEHRLEANLFGELIEAQYVKGTVTYDIFVWEGPTLQGRVVADQFRHDLFEESFLGQARKAALSIGAYALGIASAVAVPIAADHMRQILHL